MNWNTHDLAIFVGRLHPVLVHLPIGGLILLGMLELLAKFRRFRQAGQGNGLILGLSAAAAVVSALLGWVLSQTGGYDAQLLRWHEWCGFAVALTCVVSWVLCTAGCARAYRLSLAISLAVMVLASHLGGSITHGRDFLTRYAPPFFRARSAFGHRPTPASAAGSARSQGGVFENLIRPIFEKRCLPCHGAEKHKGGLSLQSYDAVRRGGTDGPVLIPGRPFESPLIDRLLLPAGEDGHMPPEGKPQPTVAEIAALQWWIDSGAPADKPVAELKPSAEMQRILAAAQADSR